MEKCKTMEREIEAGMGRLAEQNGGMFLKFDPSGARGFPDRILLLPGGKAVWVELKRPEGGRVSAAQRVAHLRLRRMGQRVEIVATMEQARALIGELAETRTRPPE